jgi:hypothetical protein
MKKGASVLKCQALYLHFMSFYVIFFIAASVWRGWVRPASCGHHPPGRGERRARQPAGACLRRQGHQELCHGRPQQGHQHPGRVGNKKTHPKNTKKPPKKPTKNVFFFVFFQIFNFL